MFKKNQSSFSGGSSFVKRNGIYVPSKTNFGKKNNVWVGEKPKSTHALVLYFGANVDSATTFSFGTCQLKATTVDIYSYNKTTKVETFVRSVTHGGNGAFIIPNGVPRFSMLKFRELEIIGPDSAHEFTSQAYGWTDIVSFGDNYKARCYPRIDNSSVTQTLPLPNPHPYIRTMVRTFKGRQSFHSSIATLDVSLIENFSQCFESSWGFSYSLAGWNTANALDMSKMFNASGYNQNVSGWNVNKVTNWASFRAGSASLTLANTPPKFR